MPIPKFIPLQAGLKHIRIEHIQEPDPIRNYWRLWLSANGDYTLGTFLELTLGGSCYRVTWLADGSEHRMEITE